MPRPQDSIQPLRKRTFAMSGFCGLDLGTSMKSSTLVPIGKWPGFVNSMRSSKMATLRDSLSSHQLLWASIFRTVSLMARKGTVSVSIRWPVLSSLSFS